MTACPCLSTRATHAAALQASDPSLAVDTSKCTYSTSNANTGCVKEAEKDLVEFILVMRQGVQAFLRQLRWGKRMIGEGIMVTSLSSSGLNNKQASS